MINQQNGKVKNAGKNQLKSFSAAFRGIFYVIRDESHMRFHLVACFYVFLFGILFHLSSVQWCILIFFSSLVIISEIINTCIERLCDIYTTKYNRSIGIIKDISAGGVLICSIFSVIAGILILGDINKIFSIIGFYRESPLALAQLAFTIIISFFFIKYGGRNAAKITK